jgi:hypothetical protein
MHRNKTIAITTFSLKSGAVGDVSRRCFSLVQ